MDGEKKRKLKEMMKRIFAETPHIKQSELKEKLEYRLKVPVDIEPINKIKEGFDIQMTLNGKLKIKGKEIGLTQELDKKKLDDLRNPEFWDDLKENSLKFAAISALWEKDHPEDKMEISFDNDQPIYVKAAAKPTL